jgi:hypothetical protein
MRQDTTIRQLEILGEAAKRVSQDVLGAHSDVPWRQTAGLRDVLIHQYMGVDLSGVWEVADGQIPTVHQDILTRTSSPISTKSICRMSADVFAASNTPSTTPSSPSRPSGPSHDCHRRNG